MGMKTALSRMLPFLALAAITDDSYPITEQGNTGGKEKEPQPKKEPIPFAKQDGIARMIEDYKVIKSGQSKKGKAKQAQLVRKIESFLESGHLSEEDLK